MDPEEMDDGYVEGMEATAPLEEQSYEEEGEETPAEYEDAGAEDEGEQEASDESALEVEAVSSTSPVPYTANESETEDDAYIREQFGDDAYRAIDRIVNRKLEIAAQSMAAGSAFVAAEAARKPELFKVHGAAIQRNLAQIPANIRGTEDGLNTAIMMIVFEESKRTGDFGNAFARMNTLMSSGKAPTAGAKAAQARPAKLALPPSQRPPVSSGAAPSRSGPVSARESLIRSLMRDDGLERGEAEMVASDPKVGGRR
jgi:hypothetical protein